MTYHELSIEVRVSIQIAQLHGFGPQALGRMMSRSPSTVSRELRRNTASSGRYVAHEAQVKTAQRLKVCRPAKRLLPGSELFELVIALLRQCFSPEHITGKLRRMSIPSFEDAYVCRETIYSAIYALPVGELRVRARILADRAVAALGAVKSRTWSVFTYVRRRLRLA